MFKLHRHKPERSGERVEFRLSSFQAFQIPRGWDRLVLSLISVETGKTIAKASKAMVHSGTCQWTETFSESIWIPQGDASKEIEECMFKLVVSMGSHRSGLLGELIINLKDYMSSWDSGSLSLPLQKCNYGTLMQVRIQCLNPKRGFRDGRSSKEASYLEDSHTNNANMDRKSNGSDNMLNRSLESSSSNHSGITYPDEPVNRETSFSASGSHHSSDSGDSAIGKLNFSPRNNLNGGSHMKRQDSADDYSRSNPSSFNSRASGSSTPVRWHESHGVPPISLRPSSSKEFLEAAEETIEELQDEAKMWERHAQKLKLDIEKYKKESSDKSKRQAELNIELSTVCSERDSLKQEIELLKISLEEAKTKQTATRAPKNEVMVYVQKELEDEVKFLKESTASLSIQLKKSQEANIELVSILEELEETVEKQRAELTNFPKQSPVSEYEGDMWSQKLFDVEAEWGAKLSAKEEEIKTLEEKLSGMPNAECPSNKELEDEVKFLKESNASLSIQLNKSQEANIELVSILEELEETVEKQRMELANFPKQSPVSEYEGEMWSQKLFHVEAEWAAKLSAKEEEIKTLEEKLPGMLNAECPSDKKSIHNHLDLMKEIEVLRGKVHELESDCAELTDENLELIFKLKKSETDIKEKEDSENFDSEVDFFKSQIHGLEEDLRIKEMLNGGMTEPSAIQIKSLEKRCADLEVELQYFKDQACHLDTKLRESQLEVKGKISELSELQKNLETFHSTTSEQSAENESDIEELKFALSLKEKDIDILQNAKEELEVLLTDIQRDKSQLEEDLTSVLRESSITSKCLEDVQHELELLASRVYSHTSTNKMLERKLMELESSKHELEIQVSELEEEKAQLSERKLGLEVQLRYLTNEKESNRREFETSLSLVADLKDKVSKQQAEIEAQKRELEQTLVDAQERMSETQEETEYLKRSHSKLQSTVESHIGENNSIQKSNGELQKQILELHEHNVHLEVELSESQKKTSEFLRKVEFLELKLSSVHNEIISREKVLNSQLESILKEHEDQEEKLSQAKLMLNQIDAEKTVEIENLKREVAHLSSQLCATQDERQRMASDAVLEVSNLRSDKIKLESSLQDARAKINQYESELQSLRQESGKKVQGLVDMLNASKQSEQMLMSDIEDMQRQTEAANSGEEKFKRMASELELKLKASEFDKQKILEETSSLKVQVQKIAHLQDNIFFLNSSLEEAKSGKVKLEELLQSASEQCEGLKTERISFMENISNMQKSLQDCEVERCMRIALEEKLLRLEKDLSAKEALYAHEAELKDEINRMKVASSEYQRKIQHLEEEKCELMSKAQVLKEEENHDKIILEKDDGKLHDLEARIRDLEAKICLLEKELAESVESNNMYKIQLQGLMVEKQGKNSEILKQNVSENNIGSQHANKIASLETELKEMKERYLNMSLQYAEVEAQREQLVMKLKTTGKGKGWFA